MPDIKVSVIIPVYGVEKYIERCCRSLFEQTMKEGIEFIFVDDCTPDTSIDIIHKVLEKYPERKPQVRLLRNDQNMGLAATRKKGMLAVQGEYFISCDSDDWVELDIYESLYNEAVNSGADIVSCPFIEETDKGSFVYTEYNSSNPKAVINSGEAIHWSACTRLVKSDLIRTNDLYPVIGLNMWEDMCVMVRAYYYANKISYLSKPLYHYFVSNSTSISHDKSMSNLMQKKRCVDMLESFFSQQNEDFSNFLNSIKLRVKIYALPDLSLFRSFYPEVNRLIKTRKDLPWPYRIVTYWASIGLYWPYRLYSSLSRLK